MVRYPERYPIEKKTGQHVCPNCGYCPHCGRANTLPWKPWKVYPGDPIWIAPIDYRTRVIC